MPQDRDSAQMAAGIPVTYVPARNTVMLSLALGLAEVLEARSIYIGVNAVDYSGYPDCRPEFLDAFERLAAVATRVGVEGGPLRIEAPLLRLTKADIVREAIRLGVPLESTWTCYDPAPDGRACSRCDACSLRLKGFEEAGERDPLEYAGGS
jgi:7-cyano-7-deazaguanine synthase